MPEDGAGAAKESSNESGVEKKVLAEEPKQTQTKVEPPEADEFGLPIRPARRRVYEEEEDDVKDEKETADKEDVKDASKDERKVVNEADATTKSDTIKDDKKPTDAEAATPTKSDALPKEKAAEGSTPAQTVNQEDANQTTEPPSNTNESPIAEPRKSDDKPRGHAYKKSIGASEWSHQALAPQENDEEEKKEELEWQDMPSLATYRQYDDWGKVTAKAYDEIEDETMAYGKLGGAAKGYTRVQDDEDAQSNTSTLR